MARRSSQEASFAGTTVTESVVSDPTGGLHRFGIGQTRSRNSSTRRVSNAVASASYDGKELSAK